MKGDAGECSVLVLLDLSSAFDTVDHRILIERLRQWVGISGSALDWFSSYLSDRTFWVTVHNYVSSAESLFCGVPQGSVLGPLLFILYLLPLGQIISNFNDVSFHCYADDVQLYFSFKPQNVSRLAVLLNCLDSVKDWMADNFLQLNTEKMEVLISAPGGVVLKVMECLGSLSASVKPTLCNLGVSMA